MIKRNRLVVIGLLIILAISAGQTTICEDKPADYRQLMAGAVRAVAEHVLPSIVAIEPVATVGTGVGEVTQDAPTSGVVVTKDGHILTSSLVTMNPTASLVVTLPDGTRKAAKVISQDFHRDLVLLKIPESQGLVPITLNEDPDATIGSTVVGVGRYGSESTPIVSRGIFSATERLDGIALQTDARVSPALYGGPLVSLSGDVLGILIPAVAEGDAANATDWYDSGIGFAIPSATLIKNLPRLVAGTSIKKGVIGIVARTKDPYDDGTEVASVRVRSPAELAGILAGDWIETVDGKAVRRHLDIKQRLGAFDAGDEITLRVRRNETSLEVVVKLVDSIPPLEPQRLGVLVKQEARDGDASPLIIVDEVLAGSPAANELKGGDVIERIAGARVPDLSSLRRQLMTAEKSTPLELNIRRQDQATSLTITPQSIGDSETADLPMSWKSQDKPWDVDPMQLPDVPNVAAKLAPPAEFTGARLGLLVVLVNPGTVAPQTLLKGLEPLATELGVVVCAIAPQDNERWRPEETDVIGRMTTLVIKQHAIDSSAVAIASEGTLSGKDAGAADAMAIAAGITEKKTFTGIVIHGKSRPPGLRLQDNDPTSPLQFLIPLPADEEAPSWVASLRKAGYPVRLGGAIDQRELLIWTRLLQAI